MLSCSRILCSPLTCPFVLDAGHRQRVTLSPAYQKPDPRRVSSSNLMQLVLRCAGCGASLVSTALNAGRSVVFQVLPPPGDSDQELVALTVFSDESAFQQRLRPYGLPDQAYLRSLLPRIYDFVCIRLLLHVDAVLYQHALRPVFLIHV